MWATSWASPVSSPRPSWASASPPSSASALSGAAGSERAAYYTAFARDHLPGVLFDADGANTIVITIPGIHGNFSSSPF